jgi:hypothetical protein
MIQQRAKPMNLLQNILIPHDRDPEIALFRTKEGVIRLSNGLKISPGIVAGRFQHLTQKWSYFNGLKRKFHWKDGTFKAIDNQRMAVSGKYTLIEPGNIRFEIFRQGSPSEIVNGTFSLQEDVLTFTSADGKEIERYKREK